MFDNWWLYENWANKFRWLRILFKFDACQWWLLETEFRWLSMLFKNFFDHFHKIKMQFMTFNTKYSCDRFIYLIPYVLSFITIKIWQIFQCYFTILYIFIASLGKSDVRKKMPSNLMQNLKVVFTTFSALHHPPLQHSFSRWNSYKY